MNRMWPPNKQIECPNVYPFVDDISLDSSLDQPHESCALNRA